MYAGNLGNTFRMGIPLGTPYSSTNIYTPVFSLPGNLIKYIFPEDGISAANMLYGLGNGANSTKLVATYIDGSKIVSGAGSDWPLLEDTANYIDVDNINLLKSVTKGQGDAISYPPTTVQVVLPSYADPILGSYSIGDEAVLFVQDDFFPNGLNLIMRIVAIDVSPGENGADRVTVTLTRQLAAGTVSQERTMAYTNIPPNLQDMFYSLDDRIRKLESGPSSAASDASDALSTANTALANAATAYAAAQASLQPSASTIVNSTNQITAIATNGITVYSGSSASTGARVVMNSAGIAGYNSSGSATFSISASTGAANFAGSITGSTITGSTLNINGNFIVDGSGFLTCTGATITGTIYASSGTVGGFTLTSYGIIGSGLSLNATGLISTSGQVQANTANIGGQTPPTSGLGVYGDIQGNSQAVFGNMTSAAPSSSYWNVMITSTGRLTRSTTNNSSRKTKDNITYLTTNTYLDTINKLQPASFTYKPNLVENPEAIQYGLIAEDVELIDKNLVGYDENGEVNSVVYERIPIYLIKAIQEITNRLTTLEAK